MKTPHPDFETSLRGYVRRGAREHPGLRRTPPASESQLVVAKGQVMGKCKLLDNVVAAIQLGGSSRRDRTQLLSPNPPGPILELELAFQRVLIIRTREP